MRKVCSALQTLWFIGLLTLIVLIPASEAAREDTIVVGLLAEPVTFDPAQATDLNTTRVIKRMFEGLAAQELGSYKIIPGLAASWTISPDRLYLYSSGRSNFS